MNAEPQTDARQLVRWLAERERRVLALEAENRALRQELARLRQGIGIALVVEGRAVPVAPTRSGSGVIVTTPMPSVTPPFAGTHEHPLPRLSAHPPMHASGPHPIPHPPRHEQPRPVYHPLAESSARLHAVGPQRPPSPASATGKVATAPRPAAGETAPAPRPEPHWSEEDPPTTREQRALREGNFLL
jgi:hypothetical protein